MKINKLNWKIKYDDILPENLFGQTNYDTLIISIKRQQTEQSIERTLLHEIVHAYVYSYGYCYKKEYSAEEVCEFIAHNLENLFELYNEALKELKGEN